jgi:hypothetical protein
MVMKLFIWEDPYYISYGTSLCVAAGETVEQARESAHAAYKESLYSGKTMPHLGEPTRVLDLPCAEWFEWSE